MTEAATTTKTGAEKIPVTMEDGSTVLFNKKQKLVKTTTIDEAAGTVSTRFDFVNGTVRNFTIPASLLLRFAGHGVEQKLGDSIAGETDMADAVLSFDDLLTRLNAGEWNIKREAGAFAGTSILIQALVEASGKTVEEIKAFLGPKTQAEKLALRRSEKIRPIVERLEAEKASKTKSNVDTGALLGELGLADEPKGKNKG